MKLFDRIISFTDDEYVDKRYVDMNYLDTINGKLTYNYTEIKDTILWFEKLFSSVTWNDGWLFVIMTCPMKYKYIFDENNYYDSFRVDVAHNRIDSNGKKIRNISKKYAIKLAKEYGWLLDDKDNPDLITGFDINKLTRNRHLLTANELGLI